MLRRSMQRLWCRRIPTYLRHLANRRVLKSPIYFSHTVSLCVSMSVVSLTYLIYMTIKTFSTYARLPQIFSIVLDSFGGYWLIGVWSLTYKQAATLLFCTYAYGLFTSRIVKFIIIGRLFIRRHNAWCKMWRTASAECVLRTSFTRL